jgi:hypothetical protein
MRWCEESAMPMGQSCPMANLMVSEMGLSCCKMMPASTPNSAIISVPVSVKEVAVHRVLPIEVLFGQNPRPPARLYASDNPPDLSQGIPIFLRVCTFLN